MRFDAAEAGLTLGSEDTVLVTFTASADGLLTCETYVETPDQRAARELRERIAAIRAGRRRRSIWRGRGR